MGNRSNTWEKHRSLFDFLLKAFPSDYLKVSPEFEMDGGGTIRNQPANLHQNQRFSFTQKRMVGTGFPMVFPKTNQPAQTPDK